MGAKEVMDRLAYEAKDMLGQGGRGVYAGGYQQAADISLGILDQKIDALMKRTTSGERLSDQELFLLGSLDALKKEMESELIDFWKRGGPGRVRTDERP
ncbi:hypothetical protein [Kitasatospora sp. NPDC050463]|uniref:hypothetical protein n=1 Tax=Kitasatospora sp. NPDC050463 TaxID=3155786 RepID=UPI003408A8D4